MSAYFIIDIKSSCMQKNRAPRSACLLRRILPLPVILPMVEPHESYR